MILTFNRAFDTIKNREKAIETIIECGCDRLLTSGSNTNTYILIPLLILIQVENQMPLMV